MIEGREFYRIRAFARVRLCPVAPEDEDQARLSIRHQRLPTYGSQSAVDESGLPADNRALLDLLRHLAMTLDRIERRLDNLASSRNGQTANPDPGVQALEITLSGSGFSGAFEGEAKLGELVEAQLDLWDAGLPLIRTLSRVMKVYPGEHRPTVAFGFEEILPEDQERIVQLAFKTQSLELREHRMGESS